MAGGLAGSVHLIVTIVVVSAAPLCVVIIVLDVYGLPGRTHAKHQEEEKHCKNDPLHELLGTRR